MQTFEGSPIRAKTLSGIDLERSIRAMERLALLAESDRTDTPINQIQGIVEDLEDTIKITDTKGV